MAEQARGIFEITMTPQPAAAGDPVGRMALAKRFHGDIVGTSTGQMLAVRTDIEDSAGYVALERVTGTLHGRDGTFALQHNGLMARGVQKLSIVIVPDSGTGALEGLADSLALEIVDGEHRYVLTYTLTQRGIAPAARHGGPRSRGAPQRVHLVTHPRRSPIR